MKHIAKKHIVLLTAAAAAVAVGVTAYCLLWSRGKPVTLADRGLQNMLLTGLGRKGGQLYEADLNSVRKLVIVSDRAVQINGKDEVTANSSGCRFQGRQYDGSGAVASLKDLAKFRNLTELTVAGNPVTELPDLSKSKLTALNLPHCSVASVKPLGGGAPSLRTLGLSYNRLEDVSALGACAGLESLDLSHNRVHSLSPLSRLARVKTADLSGNLIAGLAPLAKLGSCETLDLSGGNRVSDVSPLASLSALKDVRLNRNRISSVASLAKLKNLRQLSAAMNRIDAVSASFPALTSVDLSNNRLKAVAFSSFPAVQSADFQYNQIDSVSGVSSAKALQSLNLSYNALYALDFLKGNGGIASLGLAGNLLLSADSIGKNCPKLRQLDLSRCGLTTLKGLEACKSLQSLCVAGNSLADPSEKKAFQSSIAGLEITQ